MKFIKNFKKQNVVINVFNNLYKKAMQYDIKYHIKKAKHMFKNNESIKCKTF